jgi:hypothetical protein
MLAHSFRGFAPRSAGCIDVAEVRWSSIGVGASGGEKAASLMAARKQRDKTESSLC